MTSTRALETGSPLQRLPGLSDRLGISLWVKRDDLTPIAGGGSKLRKVQAVFRELPDEVSWIITNGAVQSNHCRTTAIAARQFGLGCTLILHGQDADTRITGNYALIRLLQCDTQIVRPADIPDTIAQHMAMLSDRGERVAVIAGGGHCPAGARAMASAAREARQQWQAAGFEPDAIVHASGTGATQAGLIAGLSDMSRPPEVIGISVARSRLRGVPPVSEALAWLGCSSDKWSFDDAYVGPGYGKADERTWSAITVAAEDDGLLLDPTYTGKAMAGLIDLVEKGRIPQASTVLFWHTGGLLNLLAEPPGVEAATTVLARSLRASSQESGAHRHGVDH